ncbi:hypothetical protein L1267_23080 [Pseudoalteromonas sp. OFAV1]|uniref:hypothetical protein n=1 Tax=Pseudoalteromonas sp. OFAV1 TaxID=2908892 RepID=UPI001F1AA2DF|nr:hypothetical protein [Pseudoalteromonas sp. OFAV1]MCF2903256.1 hypothetical protein [Pseudoalteromonas sp. OFAV1]
MSIITKNHHKSLDELNRDINSLSLKSESESGPNETSLKNLLVGVFYTTAIKTADLSVKIVTCTDTSATDEELPNYIVTFFKTHDCQERTFNCDFYSEVTDLIEAFYAKKVASDQAVTDILSQAANS